MRRRGAIAQSLVLLAGLALISLTWIGTISALQTEERAALAHAGAELGNKATLFEGQIRRRILAVDQTLHLLEDDWERDPSGFDLSYWQRRARIIADYALYIYVADARGVIRMSSRPDLIGTSIANEEAFRDRRALAADDGELFVGPGNAASDGARWIVDIARRLDTHDGKFAGVIGIAYDTAANAFFNAAELAPGSMLALIGTGHGSVYTSAGGDVPSVGTTIADTRIFRAMRKQPDGFWTGPTQAGGPVRLHAFRHVADRPLEVVIGITPDQALSEHFAWRRGAWIFAALTSLLLVAITAVLLRELRAAGGREARLAADRSVLAEAAARQAAARALAEARSEELDATLRGMSDGVLVVDAALRIVQWNDRCLEFTGLPAEIMRPGLPMEAALTAQAELGEFGPVDVKAEVARRMARLHTVTDNLIVERTRPNGRVIELRRRTLPDGGFVTLYSDITGRKRTEQALDRARALAEAASADKSRFVAMVSHEIRTPLNALLNAMTLLEGAAPPGVAALQGRQQELLTAAGHAADALRGLLDDILDMSRAEAGQLTLRPASFRLRPLLEGVLDIFAEQGRVRGSTLSLVLPPDVAETLYTDAGRLRQVLMNLVSNAVKYAGPGPIVLSAARQVENGQDLLRLGLADCGPAIDPADRPRLFQAFSRLSAPHPAPGRRPGTGLGLAICQQLTALLGGTIGHAITPADGNEFWITVPILPAPVDARASDARAAILAAPCRRLPRTRVLIVDDVAANRDMLAMLLRREAHCADTAADGASALAQIATRPYDVVLMDLLMPGLDGLATARRVRGLSGAAARVPIIALTAHPGQDEREATLAAGMGEMLGKPVNLAALLAAIGRHAWPGFFGSPSPRTEPVPLPDTTPLIDASRLGELRANLAPALLADLAEQCLTDLRARLPALHDALAARDPVAIEAKAHAIAGMAASYGMSGLDAHTRAVIAAVRASDFAGLERLSPALDQLLADSEAALRASLATADA